MRSLARFVMQMSLVVWIGGIIYFAFVVAPALFTILPSRELAGAMVTRTLGELHWIGIVAGVVFLIAGLIGSSLAIDRRRRSTMPSVLVVLMLLLTAASQVGVTPRMATLHAEMGAIDGVAATDARRGEFDRLHRWSTSLESGVLLLGIAAVALMSRD